MVCFEWAIADAGDEITSFIPEDVFGNATGLTYGASIQTGATDAADDLITEDLAGGELAPVNPDERERNPEESRNQPSPQFRNSGSYFLRISDMTSPHSGTTL